MTNRAAHTAILVFWSRSRSDLVLRSLVTGAPTSWSRRGQYLVESRIFIDLSNQATVIPSTNLDGPVIEYFNEILQGGGTSGGGGGGLSSSSMLASEESVKAMARIKVEDRESECPVCLERFAEGGELREMPCKHGYREGCILKWLEKHSTCPVCRFQFPAQKQKPIAVAARADESSDEEEDGEGEDGRMTSSRRTVLLPVTLVFAEHGDLPEENQQSG